MRIGRILSGIHALGPGERIGIWTNGCSKKCKGCISPELQPAKGPDIADERLAQLILQISEKTGCKSMTISGGDPLEQADALLRFLKIVRPFFEDILIYTGYTMDQIQEGKAGDAAIQCTELTDVLIDGRYEEAKNTRDCVLRGSTNQNIHFLNPMVKNQYQEYMDQGRILETVVHGEDTFLIGILNKEEQYE